MATETYIRIGETGEKHPNILLYMEHSARELVDMFNHLSAGRSRIVIERRNNMYNQVSLREEPVTLTKDD